MSGALVVDASVAVKWVSKEPDSDLVELLGGFDLRAPDFLMVECGNAIWRHVQLGETGSHEATQQLAQIRGVPMELVATIDLVDRAFSLSLDLGHPIYDCLYLALALATDARMVTADRRFTRVVRGQHRLADHIVLLTELAH